ncbi:MAG: hypothetical protein ABIA62_06090, partial [Candidatus Woesearchaeota archaeon]
TSRPLVIDRSSLHLVDKACKYDMCPETMKLVLDYDHYIRGSTKMKRNYTFDNFMKAITRAGVARYHQELQKERCDHPAYLFALEEIADGQFALEGEEGTLKTVIYKGEKMPYGGVMLDR